VPNRYKCCDCDGCSELNKSDDGCHAHSLAIKGGSCSRCHIEDIKVPTFFDTATSSNAGIRTAAGQARESEAEAFSRGLHGKSKLSFLHQALHSEAFLYGVRRYRRRS
jgi:hypothetical protein